MRNFSKFTVGYILLIVIITVLLVMSIVRLVSGSDAKKPIAKVKAPTIAKVAPHSRGATKVPTPAPKSQDTPQPKPTPSPAPAPAPAPVTTPTPALPPTTSPPTASTPVDPKLANSGPGDVLFLFAGTALLGGLLHNRLTATRKK